MESPPLGPAGEDITWPNQVAPRGRKASSTTQNKPQTSNLKSYTVRTSRGLPLNASYACTNMHRAPNFSFSCLILHNLTNQSVTQPGGELLLGLPTLLTTYRMNAEENTSAKQTYGEF